MVVWFGLLGGLSAAQAQEPALLPMPGVPAPKDPPKPFEPVPPPPPVPGQPTPGLPPVTPFDPNAPSPEDAPIIDFIPAARPDEELSAFALEYKETHNWREIRLGVEARFESVTQVADSEALVVLGDSEGGVWVSNDGLISARETLPGVVDSVVAALGGGESIEDLLSNVDVEAINNEAFQDEEALQEVAQMIQQAIEEGTAAQVVEAETRLSVAAPRFSWIEGVLFVGRGDGLFRSTDRGTTFERVLAGDVRDVARTELGFIAATSDGIRYSGDGISWIDQTDGSEGRAIHAVAALAGAAALAVTDQGLLHTDDGFAWRLRSRSDQPMRTMSLDPDMPGRIWVGTPGNVLSSDNMGATFQPPLSGVLPGVSNMSHLGSLHWLAGTTDGVWETTNGGLGWAPVVTGLNEPTVTDLSAVSGRILIAAGGRIHRLVDSNLAAFDPDAHAKLIREQISTWIPRDQLLDSSLYRPGLTARQAGSPALQYLLPQVTVYGWLYRRDGVIYRSGLSLDEPLLEEDAGTIREFLRWSAVSVAFRWAPPGKKRVGVGGAEGSTAGADVGVALDAVATLDDGASSAAAISYQADLARRINELYSQRIEVVAQRLEASRQPLMQQVFLELAIQEIEADLDVYTNGAVFEWNRSKARSPDGGVP